jgi:transcriptional repressor NrdR
VTDTRHLEDGAVIRRRRTCDSCGNRFVTYERHEGTPLTVIKRNGSREIFDPNKILAGVVKSCNIRHVSMDQMESLVADVTAECRGFGKKEVESREIGELVMNRLKELDEVSYIRFASVYKKFGDIDTFMAEITGLLKERSEEKK